MSNHENLQFKDPDKMPTLEMLEEALGESFASYESFQNALSDLEIEQVWQWYTPYKAWFAKGQHYWTTPRGAKKEKNLYWLYIYDKYFTVAVWFKEKNRMEISKEGLSEIAINKVLTAETMGKVPTFPIIIDVRKETELMDIYSLLESKKRLEK